jgi:hypothetical protein
LYNNSRVCFAQQQKEGIALRLAAERRTIVSAQNSEAKEKSVENIFNIFQPHTNKRHEKPKRYF